VAAYGAGNYRASQGRGPAAGFSFTVYAVLAIVLMALDRRGGWLNHARYYLSAAAYPLQLAVSSPGQAWHWSQESLTARETLQAQNAELRQRDRDLSLKVMRLAALERENADLRGLRAALPPVADHWMAAEVIATDEDPTSQRQRLVINRGVHNGVFKGQTVMDSYGVLGQTTRVGPWSSEVMLITDPEHAIPVEIARTGVHTLALGTGDPDSLSLRFLPGNADIKTGDLLLTSGLGGVFPQGYPVARVAAVRREAVEPLAQFRATPLAQLASLREVMLVWFQEDHPAAPSQMKDGQSSAQASTGNASVQRLPAPALELLPLPDEPKLVPLLPPGALLTPPPKSAKPGKKSTPAASAPKAAHAP
jgi:rod shape-determining protein MreC